MALSTVHVICMLFSIGQLSGLQDPHDDGGCLLAYSPLIHEMMKDLAPKGQSAAFVYLYAPCTVQREA